MLVMVIPPSPPCEIWEDFFWEIALSSGEYSCKHEAVRVNKYHSTGWGDETEHAYVMDSQV